MRGRVFVAFDAGSVSGGWISRSLAGPRIRSLVRVPVPPGALVPSPVEGNVLEARALREALEAVRQALGTDGRRAVLLLPDGVARSLVLDAPRRVEPDAYARFRLAPGLPFPASEAICGVLPLGRGRLLATAIRRRVVEDYEDLAAAAGLAQERLSLSPLAALRALMARPPGSGVTVEMILGDAAFSLGVAVDGEIRAFRSRRRDPGPAEARRLAEEAERCARLTESQARPRVRVVGSGALALLDELRGQGFETGAGWQLPAAGSELEATELAWLGAALA